MLFLNVFPVKCQLLGKPIRRTPSFFYPIHHFKAIENTELLPVNKHSDEP